MSLKEERITRIIKRLRREYPKSKVSLRHKSPFQLLIATILSAQCTDKRANRVASYLFKKYRNVKNFSKARQDILEKEIYSAGFYKHKARNIIAASKRILAEYNGGLPDTMDELTSLPGVGRKTANIILSSAFNKAEGIAVDTHVKRLTKRLGLSNQEDPNKIERQLLKVVPRRDWLDFNYIFVNHGRNICKAQNPLCCECAINYLCPFK